MMENFINTLSTLPERVNPVNHNNQVHEVELHTKIKRSVTMIPEDEDMASVIPSPMLVGALRGMMACSVPLKDMFECVHKLPSTYLRGVHIELVKGNKYLLITNAKDDTSLVIDRNYERATG